MQSKYTKPHKVKQHIIPAPAELCPSGNADISYAFFYRFQKERKDADKRLRTRKLAGRFFLAFYCLNS